MAESINQDLESKLRSEIFRIGNANYDRLLSVFHTGTHVKRCLLEYYLRRNDLDLLDWLTNLSQNFLQFEDVKNALKRSNKIQLTDLELNTIDILLKNNCYAMYWDCCLLNTKLEDILNRYKEVFYKIYQNSNGNHDASSISTLHYKPHLTQNQWELLFKIGDNWGIMEDGYDHYISADKGITVSSLDNNLHFVLLYIVCPLFKSVNAVSECQIQISEIAVLDRDLEQSVFEPIWNKMEEHIVKIGEQCELSRFFQRKCATLKETVFNRTLVQENRKGIIDAAFNNAVFIKNISFCNRMRKELDLITLQDNLNLARKLCGRELPITLERGYNRKGAYSLRVLENAEDDLNMRKSVSSNQETTNDPKEKESSKKTADIQERFNRHNHLKLVQLITTIGRDVLVDVMKERLPDADYGYAFKGLKNRIIPLLNNHEIQLLYPDNSFYDGDLSDLDISLIYIILRNLNTICPHKKGWGKKPKDNDRCIAANIERIRIFKNMHVSHSSKCSLNEEDFLKTWKEIRQCIIQLGGTAYISRIDSLLTSEINPVIEKELFNTLERLKEVERQYAMNNNRFEGDLNEVRHHLNMTHGQISDRIPTTNNLLGNVSLELIIEGENIPSAEDTETIIRGLPMDDVRKQYVKEGSIIIGLDVSPSALNDVGRFLEKIDILVSSILQRNHKPANGRTTDVIVSIDFMDTKNEPNQFPLIEDAMFTKDKEMEDLRAKEIEMEIKELSKRHIQCETNFPLKDTGALGKLKKILGYSLTTLRNIKDTVTSSGEKFKKRVTKKSTPFDDYDDYDDFDWKPYEESTDFLPKELERRIEARKRKENREYKFSSLSTVQMQFDKEFTDSEDSDCEIVNQGHLFLEKHIK